MSAHDNEIGILARRRIEAEIIKPIYDILVRDYGKDKAAAVIGEAVSQAAINAGQQFAAREPDGPDLQKFVALQSLWKKDDALEVDIIATDADRFDYDVHRCRYAEMYRDMGLGDIGHLLSCARDEYFIVGYDPSVELTRTQTLMEGDSYCNFRYRVKASGHQA